MNGGYVCVALENSTLEMEDDSGGKVEDVQRDGANDGIDESSHATQLFEVVG